MNVLIKSATILDKKSDFNNTVQDILIENGFIKKIEPSINNIQNFPLINFENLHISQGWFDSSVCFGEPGYEDRETIKNGLIVAAKSGFTYVVLQPNTSPVLDEKSAISFVKNNSTKNATTILPSGALPTKSSEGNSLAENI